MAVARFPYGGQRRNQGGAKGGSRMDTKMIARGIMLSLLVMFCLVTLCPAVCPGGTIAESAEKPVVVRLWNWNIHDKKYQQSMYNLFNKRHKDIKIEYSSISNTVYDQTLEAAFAAKEPPDIFLPSGRLTFEYLRSKGWIMPLNDCAPSERELKDWMDKFPPHLYKFIEGISVFNGKVYVVDTKGESGAPGFPLYYNKTLFKLAGIGSPPSTYSELRHVAAKITQAGQGKYFGIVHGLRYKKGVWHQDIAGSLARSAGIDGVGGPDWGPDARDGKYHHASPEHINALKVWIGMREDGSVHPGEMTMDDEQAKMAFANNKAAMFFGGDWVVGNVLAYNPDCDFDLVLAPTPDDGIRRDFYHIGPGGQFGYVVSSFTKNPRAVWEVIKFICSLEYQEGYVKGGYGISYLPEANKPENFKIPQLYRFVQWANDPALRRFAPIARPNTRRVVEEFMPGIYPTYHDVMEAVYLGKAGFEALKDLDDRCNAALDAGIKRAQESGIKVTRDDFCFPDWVRGKDYEPTLRALGLLKK